MALITSDSRQNALLDHQVSIADLLGMTSGIQDYDGLLYMDWTLLFGQVRLQLQ